MCLAYPGKIVQIEGDTGEVDFGGFTKRVSLMLMPAAKLGDMVLVHAGFAIGATTEQDAEETREVLRQIDSAFMPEEPR